MIVRPIRFPPVLASGSPEKRGFSSQVRRDSIRGRSGERWCAARARSQVALRQILGLQSPSSLTVSPVELCTLNYGLRAQPPSGCPAIFLNQKGLAARKSHVAVDWCLHPPDRQQTEALLPFYCSRSRPRSGSGQIQMSDSIGASLSAPVCAHDPSR
jgi:hypothetical protein